jgi:hypothetical protein
MVGLSLFPSRVEVSEHKTLLKLNWKERKEKRKKFLLLFPQEFPRKGKKENIPYFLPSSTPSPGGKSPAGSR